MSREVELKNQIARFIARGIKNIENLSAEELISNAGINPLLVKALGIQDFNALAKFYVYQRVGRSLVTSFGSTIENIIRTLSGGTRAQWWDIKATIQGRPYYMSVKSGPRDMDKDQVEHFVDRALKLRHEEPDAVPVIAMGYGREPLGPIPYTLKNKGFNPIKNTLTGKALYDTITGQENYHEQLLALINDAALLAMSGQSINTMIEKKIEELTQAFQSKYKTLDALLLDVF